jgi:release factor glutamine methyltransferase
MDKLDHEILLAYVLGVSRTWLRTYPEKINLFPEQQKTFDALMKRREQGEPIAYLIGQQEFWSLPLAVNEHTLVPRPETELLVEVALGIGVKSFSPLQTVADLGTGSGAIAIALAHEKPNWKILATDQSETTLEVAKHNAANLHVTNITFYIGHWCAALPKGTQCDMIISNPPYIAEHDPHLQQDGVCYEPMDALVAGKDGLDDIRQIILEARQYLKQDGWLLLEHGYDQGISVRNSLQSAHYRHIQTYQDFAGLDRVTTGQI